MITSAEDRLIVSISLSRRSASPLSRSATNAAKAATCTDELQRLAMDWRAMSFPDVLKPSARILGHDGRDYTGGQINYIKTEIRLAHVDLRRRTGARRLGSREYRQAYPEDLKTVKLE